MRTHADVGAAVEGYKGVEVAASAQEGDVRDGLPAPDFLGDARAKSYLVAVKPAAFVLVRGGFSVYAGPKLKFL